MSQLNSLTIYPNPSDGLFKVFIPQLTNTTTIEIYNNLGALVFDQVIIQGQNTIEFTNHANGLYFIKVVSGDQIIATQRIIKQ